MRSSLTFILVLCLAGCGMLPAVNDDETRGWSANKLYTEAKTALNETYYEKAVKYYEKLEARYPYGRYAQQAQLEIAYAYYKDKDVTSAIAAADRFIKLHPNHPSVDYAYYLKGLATFNDDLGILGNLASKFSGQDMTERDPKTSRDSFDSFRDLVARFPNSKYAPDSIERMNYLVNSLAAHEVHVAKYYMKRGAYVAAANRVQYCLKSYPNAPANEEGLLILVQAYDKLGMADLRNDAERVMKTNFPESKYLSGKAVKNASWWQIWNID
ncbi:MAG: outer rane assembly lipoprotein YfiO [Betaproteobacteria bacterium]|nr:outer rane assembly lipoprotein YfiO [Betaproteobacteria bacterium]